MAQTDHRDEPIVLDAALEAATCEALVAKARAAGFDAAPVAGGPRVVDAGGASKRGTAAIDGPRLALRLYHKLAGHLPVQREGRVLAGIDPRMHVVRYETGDRTELHCDAPVQRSEHEHSEFTILVYLDEDFDGGATAFADGVEVSAERGRLVLFDRRRPHYGAEVQSGTKHVLRAEVYYTSDERAIDRA